MANTKPLWTNKEAWRQQLAAERKKFWLQVSQAQRILCLEATKSIIFKTPVDTGRARANWQAGVDAPVRTTTLGTDKNGARTISAASRVIAKMPPLHSFWLSNNLVYISALEDGSSTQAPEGMVGITVAEIEASGNLEDLTKLLGTAP